MKSRKYDKAFITGCDENCEWQLPWFLKNYFEFNDTPLIFMNFGCSDKVIPLLESYNVEIVSVPSNVTGWFKKPRAIWNATELAEVVCWLDTDCQVMDDISSIFNHFEQCVIGMVEDRPWTKRRGTNGAWHNSGVVLTNRNVVLKDWMEACESDPKQGDQEVLYYSMSPIQRLGKIKSLPHKFNTLRLDYIDGVDVKDPLIIHHTGAKGNQVIKEMM